MVGQHNEPTQGEVKDAMDGKLIAHRFQNDQDTIHLYDAQAFVAFEVDRPNGTNPIWFGEKKSDRAFMVLRERVDGIIDGFDNAEIALVIGQWVASEQEAWEEIYGSRTLQ